MHKVTITALPRQGYRGFGAVGRYFESGIPAQIEVSDAEYKELHEDPASYFLKVEDGFVEPKTDAPAEPGEVSEEVA